MFGAKTWHQAQYFPTARIWAPWNLEIGRSIAIDEHVDLYNVAAESEVEVGGRMGLKNRVIVAPLGVKIDDRIERIERVDGKKVLLFVSRVQRKKGLENLVRAWAQLKNEVSTRSVCSTRLNNWIIRIVGPDQEGHTAELMALCNELGVASDFEFVGSKYGEELQREYASADLFVCRVVFKTGLA